MISESQQKTHQSIHTMGLENQWLIFIINKLVCLRVNMVLLVFQIMILYYRLRMCYILTKKNHQESSIADYAEFYPEQLLKDQPIPPGIKVQKFYMKSEYLDPKTENRSLLDFVFLKLQKNATIKPNQSLRLNFQYNFDKDDTILISGYGGNVVALEDSQLYEQGKVSAIHQNFLCYKHTTLGGNSGGPILLKISDNKYEVIGIHKGSMGHSNYCLLLKALKANPQISKSLKQNPQINQKTLSKYWKQYYVQSFRHKRNDENLQKKSQLNEKQIISLIQQKDQEILNLKIQLEHYKNQNKKLESQMKNYHLEQDIKLDESIKQFNQQTKITLSPSLNAIKIVKKKTQIQLKSIFDIKNSSILQQKHIDTLISWLIKPIKKIQLKFKASQHNFSISKYYQICGQLRNTIIIANTSQDKIIGGYSRMNFNPSQSIINTQNNQWVKDLQNETFTFSLSEKQKFNLKNGWNAIYRPGNRSYICFYGQFVIYNNSNKQTRNWFQLSNLSYDTSMYPNTKESFLKITGNQTHHFLTKQWEVYQVMFE